jgi:CubicO group peptidase (beta-lactamase class C family)
MLNNGKYDGGQILNSETIELMFNNQLPNGLTLNAGGKSMESDTHGLAWAIEDSEDELLRSKGSAYWSGLANSYYSLDKEKDVAIVYFTNFFPYADKETVDFYRLFEKEVYTSLKTK